MTEVFYQTEGGRRVTLGELYGELNEIYHAASGLMLLLEELAEDLTENGLEPARYLMARLTVRHALELIWGLMPASLVKPPREAFRHREARPAFFRPGS